VISAKLMYGGLQTIASSFSPWRGASSDPLRNSTGDFSPSESDAALAAATLTASSDTSVAKTRSNSASNASESAIAP